MNQVIPKFNNDATLQLEVPDEGAVTLLSLLVAAGENETQMLKIDTWSIDIESIDIRIATNGNAPTTTKGVRLREGFMYSIQGTADMIKVIGSNEESIINISPGVLSKGF